MLNNLIILSIIFYLIGSIPFALIFSKIFGLGDIRKIGSGNIGATNVLRAGNKKIAFLVLFFDILKGYLPLIILNNLILSNSYNFLIYYIASLSIIGHIFPIWLKFKGGKGVATYIGFLISFDYLLAIIFILSWLIIAKIKRYSSLASIVSLIILPCACVFLSYNIIIISLFFIISIIIILKHYSNILRLLDKSESKINF